MITGATIGLGPAYCNKLMEAGFHNFVLIDEDIEELLSLKKRMIKWAFENKIEIGNLYIDVHAFDFN